MADMEYIGHPVYITTQRWQKRKHRKKRINKKWAKRYGYHELEVMPHNQVVITEDGTLWMTYKTWKDLQKGINEELIKNFCESEEAK